MPEVFKFKSRYKDFVLRRVRPKKVSRCQPPHTHTHARTHTHNHTHAHTHSHTHGPRRWARPSPPDQPACHPAPPLLVNQLVHL